LQADLAAIGAAVRQPEAWRPDPQRLDDLLDSASERVLLQRWEAALAAINLHWDRLLAGEKPLVSPSLWQLRIGSLAGRLRLKR